MSFEFQTFEFVSGLVLRISDFTLLGMVKISNFFVKIRDWLDGLIVLPVLLYRRLRYGYTFRRIRMSGPKYAKVDADDYKRLRKYEWFTKKETNSFYTFRNGARKKAGGKSIIYMHQIILEVPKGMVVDHINNDGMDNRSTNLRPATRAQNSYNRKKLSRQCTSKYKGICWNKTASKWQAAISFNKKIIYLGIFNNEFDAAKAYDEAAKKYHGEFACLNFPE